MDKMLLNMNLYRPRIGFLSEQLAVEILTTRVVSRLPAAMAVQSAVCFTAMITLIHVDMQSG